MPSIGHNGVEADTALVTVSYDLLILDLGLPKMSGLEVLKRLRARNSQLPVLILTALDGTGDRVMGLDLGADDYMAQPRAGRTGSPCLCPDPSFGRHFADYPVRGADLRPGRSRGADQRPAARSVGARGRPAGSPAPLQ